MVYMRVYTGIKDHFPIRVTEWVMVIPTFGMFLALLWQPDMFSISPSFAAIRGWASEQGWGLLFLVTGVFRIIALTVNGTFKTFQWSPHIRMAASLVGIVFWSQFTLGFVNAFFAGTGALSPIVAYGTFCIYELVNFWRSNIDRARGKSQD